MWGEGGKFQILRPFQGVGGAGRIAVTDDSKVLGGLGEGCCCPESWLRCEADSHRDGPQTGERLSPALMGASGLLFQPSLAAPGGHGLWIFGSLLCPKHQSCSWPTAGTQRIFCF